MIISWPRLLLQGSSIVRLTAPAVQAAEQGDADKVGKKRKKSKAKAEEEALFGEKRAPADRAAVLRETGAHSALQEVQHGP